MARIMLNGPGGGSYIIDSPGVYWGLSETKVVESEHEERYVCGESRILVREADSEEVYALRFENRKLKGRLAAAERSAADLGRSLHDLRSASLPDDKMWMRKRISAQRRELRALHEQLRWRHEGTDQFIDYLRTEIARLKVELEKVSSPPATNSP